MSTVRQLYSPGNKGRGKGASIFDVRTLGGEGVPGEADEVRELNKGGCVKNADKEGGVKKIGKLCRRHKWRTPKGESIEKR